MRSLALLTAFVCQAGAASSQDGIEVMELYHEPLKVSAGRWGDTNATVQEERRLEAFSVHEVCFCGSFRPNIKCNLRQWPDLKCIFWLPSSSKFIILMILFTLSHTCCCGTQEMAEVWRRARRLGADALVYVFGKHVQPNPRDPYINFGN